MKLLRSWCHGVVLICVVGFAAAQPAATPNTPNPADPSPELRRQGPHSGPPVSARLTNAFVLGRNWHAMPDLLPQEVADADRFARNHAAQFGPNNLVPPRIGLTRRTRKIAPGEAGSGTWADVPNGRKLWSAAIQSPKAYGLRVHFSQFDAGDQTVRVYARSGDEIIERGAYTGRGPNKSGEFWAATLPGEKVFVEMIDNGSRPAAFEIDEILHFDKPVYGIAPAVGTTQPILGCHLEPACQPQAR